MTMAAAAEDPMLLATDLAEVLVREGVAFREAHEAVGHVVQHCISKDLDLRSLSREDLQAFRLENAITKLKLSQERGEWQLKLPPLPAGVHYVDLIVSTKDGIENWGSFAVDVRST